jgi:putative membrane protein
MRPLGVNAIWWGLMGEWGWGMGGFGMLAYWVLLALIFALLVKYATGSGREKDTSALDIIKKRYARGEIDREEFEQLKHDLEK